MQCLQCYNPFAIPLHQLFYPRGWSKHIGKLALTLWVEGDTLTKSWCVLSVVRAETAYY